MARGAFPQRRNRWLYLALSLWMLALTVAGFWRTYFGPLLSGSLDLGLALELHAPVFFGWMVLLVAQAALAFSGRVDLHRKLGAAIAVYGVFLIAVGVWLIAERFSMRIAMGDVRDAHRHLVIPTVDLLLFASFFVAAILFRRRPEVHKRLIIVASFVMLGPPVARLPFVTSFAVLLLLLLSPLIVGIASDTWPRRRPHPAYLIGLAAFFISIARLPLRDSEAWLSFSKSLFGPT